MVIINLNNYHQQQEKAKIYLNQLHANQQSRQQDRK